MGYYSVRPQIFHYKCFHGIIAQAFVPICRFFPAQMSCTDYTVIDRYLLTIKLEKNIEKPDFSSISAELELPPMHMHVMNYYTSLTFDISKQALQGTLQQRN
jgi:hypothetical protein